MIYICKALTLPCKLCEKTCQGLAALCKESCRGCGNLCASIGDFFGPITRGPLGGYVVGTWLAMVLAAVGFGVTASEAKCKEARLFCLVNLGIALAHMFFARYIQWRLTGSIQRDGQDAQVLSHKEIADKATHIALYDVGFCLYTFFFFGALAYNVYGLSTLCKGTGPAWGAAAIQIAYGILVCNYFFCWYCMQACCGVKESRREGGKMPSAKEGVDVAEVVAEVPV